MISSDLYYFVTVFWEISKYNGTDNYSIISETESVQSSMVNIFKKTKLTPVENVELFMRPSISKLLWTNIQGRVIQNRDCLKRNW